MEFLIILSYLMISLATMMTSPNTNTASLNMPATNAIETCETETGLLFGPCGRKGCKTKEGDCGESHSALKLN